MKYTQYDIYWANLDPTLGTEIKKTRPVVIVSPDSMNQNLKGLIICPLTSSIHPTWATRIQCTVDTKLCEIAVDQIRYIDKQHLYRKIASANSTTISEIKNTIAQLFIH